MWGRKIVFLTELLHLNPLMVLLTSFSLILTLKYRTSKRFSGPCSISRSVFLAGRQLCLPAAVMTMLGIFSQLIHTNSVEQ